ncbi:MAG: DUF6132 family protein [Prevotellaceae bacterium]|jgi:hypothetical protein|nr:DUF6132 family protein [Prevotellaceae bacterium]
MHKLKKILKNNLLILAGGVIGAVAGYFYWLNIGCSTGSCPLTSTPGMSIIWGAITGGLLFNIFQTKGEKR